MPFTSLEISLAVAVLLLAALIQGSVGMGFNIIAVSLTLLIDPRMAPVPQLMVSIVLTAVIVAREWRHIDLSGTGWIIVGRVPGLVIGLGLLTVATPRALDAIIAIAILIGVLAMAAGPALARTPGISFGAGVVSGTTSVVSAIGGPPVALLYKDDDGPAIRATLGAVFTIGATISLLGRAATGLITQTDLKLAAVYLPAVLLGVAVSSAINRRFEGARYRMPILALSAIAAVSLLLRSLVG